MTGQPAGRMPPSVAGREKAGGPTSARRLPFAAAFVPSLALYTLLRLPSFFEPHWYTDEAGYLTTARALLKGRVLYAGIWTNKPPLHLWTVALLDRLFGTSEFALHAATYVFGAAAVAAVAFAGARLLSPRAAVAAGVVYALLIGFPIFDAELLIPESLLIAPVTWCGVLVVLRLADPRWRPSPGWALGAGLLGAAAIAYQQSEAAEVGAFAFLLLISPRVRWREFALFIGTVLAVTLVWLAGAVAVAGWAKVDFALAGFYSSYRQVPSDVVARLAMDVLQLVGALLVPAAAWLLRRRRGAWPLWIWGGAALLVPAAAQQPYPHLLTPSLAPLTLALFTLRRPRLPRLALNRRTLGVSAAALGVIVAAFFGARSGVDWIPNLAGAPWMNNYRNFDIYYVGFARVLAGRTNLEAWQDEFDVRVAADANVSQWIRGHELQQGTVVVWSSDAWPYVESDADVKLPTAPIYNNFILLGQQGQVTAEVKQLNPAVIVTASQELSEYSEIVPYLRQNYQVAYVYAPDTVWVRNDLTGMNDLAGSGLPSQVIRAILATRQSG